MTKKATKCIDGSHPVCIGSDSKLPECLCWCAECKEMMAEIRKNYKNNKQTIIREIKEWA